MNWNEDKSIKMNLDKTGKSDKTGTTNKDIKYDDILLNGNAGTTNKNSDIKPNVKYNDILSKLDKYKDENIVPMHMPGAKRNKELIELYMGDMGNPYEKDITEINGFDNMHNAETIIKDAFDEAAELYGADESWYLVNGSTAGNMSAICGVTHKNDVVIMARNCHISVYNAVILNELNPVYIYPEYDEEYGYYKGITLKEIKVIVDKYSSDHDRNDIKAVILTSPTYEGNVSDIKSIAEYLHQYNIPLIVDEAHGAHFNFSESFPQSAVKSGADVVINSVHKTLPSLTQTAIMHINYGIVDVERIRRYWNIYQSTSPSYILMSSIARSLSIVKNDGDKLFAEYVDKLTILRNGLSELKHIRLINTDDISKLVLGYKDAKWLYDTLFYKYKIQLEMSSIKYVIAMTSIFDSQEYYDRFLAALKEIDEELDNRVLAALKEIDEEIDESISKYDREDILNSKVDKDLDNRFNSIHNGEADNRLNYSSINNQDNGNKINVVDFRDEQALTIAEAFNRRDLSGCDEIQMNNEKIYGKISGESVYVYPPGIPILCPGEVITRKIIAILEAAGEAGLEVVGVKEGALLCLR
jgi:arginine decarboxylase